MKPSVEQEVSVRRADTTRYERVLSSCLDPVSSYLLSCRLNRAHVIGSESIMIVQGTGYIHSYLINTPKSPAHSESRSPCYTT